MYREEDLVRIAKRENNTKRKYLVVNRLQGKHIPVSPKEAFAMFDALAELVEDAYSGERLLLVGFAETATAIGAALAVKLDTFYMQTTREKIEGVRYLYFSEAHSHATEQKLIRTDLDQVIDQVDRIIFVEDEVTTGNTILNIIDIIENVYGKKVCFSVASLLNGMNEQARECYEERNIRLHYLVKTNHDSYTKIAESYCGDGIYRSSSTQVPEVEVKTLTVSDYRNARRLNRGGDYLKACGKLWEHIRAGIEIGAGQRFLVLGTEEFMYPALLTAKYIEEKGNFVRCHATTRSPIAVSKEEDYPLHTRYELVSLYDKGRKTFLYDMEQYDKVIIITDSDAEEKEGIYSLVHAVRSCGNQEIYFVRWCESEKFLS